MSKREKPKLWAFVEQTAQMLRSAANAHLKKKRSYSKKTLGNPNKIEQIAKMLREQAKKHKK